MTTSVFNLSPTPRTWTAYTLLLGVLTCLCFGNLRFHLLETHDSETFRDNAKVSADFVYFFSDQKEQASGRLLHEFCMWLAHLAWGQNPAAFHLLVVALHLVASLLLCRVFIRAGADLELSMLASLLFLLNVAHFRAIYWLSGFNYVLALVLGLLAVLAYLRFIDKGHIVWLAACYASLVLGAFSHLASLMAWPFCLFLAWQQGRDLRRALRHLAPFVLLLIPALALVLRFTAKRTSTWEALDFFSVAGLWDLVAGIIRSTLFFASRLLTTAHWLPLPSHQRHPWEFAVGALVLAGLAWLIWKRQAPAALWAGWTVLMLVPFVLLTEESILALPVGPSRYLYLPSAGSSLLLAWLIQQAGLWAIRWRDRGGRILYVGVLVGLVCASGLSLKKAEALAFYMSARHYLASGNNDTGIALMEQAIALGPDIINSQNAHENLGLLHLLNPERFADFLPPALAQFPKSIPLNIYSQVYESMSPNSSGQREARNHLDSSGGDPESAKLIGKSYHNLGMGFYQNGETERSIAAYQQSLRFLPNRTTTLNHLAQALRQKNDLSASASVLIRAAQLAPHDPSILYSAALGLHLLGEPARAVEYCLAALELQPNAELYLLLGTCYLELQQTSQAQTAYRQSIALDPQQLVAYTHLANTLETPQAITTLEQALTAGIENAELYKRLGRLYFQQGEAAQAAELHRLAIAIAPDNVQAHTNLGAILKTLDQWQEARHAYAQASALEPHNPAHPLQIAELSRAQGDLPAAIDAYREALRLGPDNALARTNFGWLLYENGALDEAIDHYRQVLEHQPNSAAQFNLGLALLAKGDSATARQTYAIGIELYGAAEAEQIGAVTDLKILSDQGMKAARDIIETHWP